MRSKFLQKILDSTPDWITKKVRKHADLLLYPFTLKKHDGHFYLLSNDTAYPVAYHLLKNEVIRINYYGEKSGELYHKKGFNYKRECMKLIASTEKIEGIHSLDIKNIESFVGAINIESHKDNKFSSEDMVEFAKWLKHIDNGTIHYNPENKEESESIGFSPFDCFIDDLKTEEELVNHFIYSLGRDTWKVRIKMTDAKEKIPCSCSCHYNSGTIHFSACCDNGFIRNFLTIGDRPELDENGCIEIIKIK